jgi:hypothetical protein
MMTEKICMISGRSFSKKPDFINPLDQKFNVIKLLWLLYRRLQMKNTPEM